MAVKIRMRRMGNKNKPFFRIVATDERSPQTGRYLENLGWYDPKEPADKKCFELKLDRVDHWVKCGAIMADSVRPLVRKARRAASAAAAAAPSASAAAT
jgi:small subunit ribosomal protein S16